MSTNMYLYIYIYVYTYSFCFLEKALRARLGCLFMVASLRKTWTATWIAWKLAWEAWGRGCRGYRHKGGSINWGSINGSYRDLLKGFRVEMIMGTFWRTMLYLEVFQGCKGCSEWQGNWLETPR